MWKIREIRHWRSCCLHWKFFVFSTESILSVIWSKQSNRTASGQLMIVFERHWMAPYWISLFGCFSIKVFEKRRNDVSKRIFLSS